MCKDREMKYDLRSSKYEIRFTKYEIRFNLNDELCSVIDDSRFTTHELTNQIIIVDLFSMSLWSVLLAIIFPPLAVIGRGCGSVLIVFILTVCGWVPGVIAALIILNNPKK